MRTSHIILLTKKSRKLNAAYHAVSKQMNELFYEGFTEEEIVQFEGYLQRILNNLMIHEN